MDEIIIDSDINHLNSLKVRIAMCFEIVFFTVLSLFYFWGLYNISVMPLIPFSLFTILFAFAWFSVWQKTNSYRKYVISKGYILEGRIIFNSDHIIIKTNSLNKKIRYKEITEFGMTSSMLGFESMPPFIPPLKLWFKTKSNKYLFMKKNNLSQLTKSGDFVKILSKKTGLKMKRW